MIAIHTAAIRPSAADYTRTPSKTADADKPAASTRPAPTVESTSKAALASSARLVDAMMGAQTVEAGSSGASSKAVDGLLAKSGSAIFGSAIGSAKKTLPTIMPRLNELTEKSLTQGGILNETEQAEGKALSDEMTAREYKAFFHYAMESYAAPTQKERSELMAKYYQAYTKYYDSMSPEDQASARYAGSRGPAVAAYQSWSEQAGELAQDLKPSQDPTVMLISKIADALYNLDEEGTKKVLDDYKSSVAKLLSSQTDPQGTADKAQAASERLLSVQKVIEEARKGDQDALGHLQSLADDPKALDSFLGYASSLTAMAAAA